MVAVNTIESSFLSCERDLSTIIEMLFLKQKPHSDVLKKLLVVTNKDCLTNSADYQNIINNKSIADLINEGYIRNVPKLEIDKHIKNYILITFTNFEENNTNKAFRDCMINFDIICHQSNWTLDNFALRPIKILGYIDGILNGKRLAGIGTLQFAGADIILLDNELMGYTISFRAIHSTLPSTGGDRSISVTPR